MDIISQYILSLVPSVTAIVGMIVFIGVGIGKIRKANEKTVKTISEVDKRSKDLEQKLIEVTKENIELKKSLKKVVSKMEHIHFVDKGE